MADKMNLAARYAALKQKVGGNYEKKAFEFTMRPTRQESNHITPPSKANRRILSEIQFALGLSGQNQGKYDALIDGALRLLENEMGAEGVLTNRICQEAEKILLPLEKDAKAYTVLYAAHAHIDMNWMWGFQETVAITLSTFRTMLNLMQEYEGFTFSQSQASCYKIVEEYDPDMMAEIRQRIKEGRWEVTANAWVETDKNMPDTESLYHHFTVTRNYLKETWGIDPDSLKVDFSPDTFGHSRFIPEINQFAHVPYYYHCRGLQDELTLYRYKAPSGKEILMYKEPYWYNSGVNPDNGTGVFEMEKRCGGLKTALIVYGVGNHGGGPTRRDIETMLEMQQWPIFPTLKFGTIHEYFAAAEAVREKTPVIDHELNAIFTGCYSTQSRIKLGNRRAEMALLDSQCMSALAHCALGTAYPARQYEKAWQNVLFTHFHDILTGSCVQESREHAMGKLAEAIAHAQTGQKNAYEKLSQAVDTSMFPADPDIADSRAEGAGPGFGISHYAGVPNPERNAGKTRIYTVFNPDPQPRKELVEFVVWDYTGDPARVKVMDHEGKNIPFQWLDDAPQTHWDHEYLRLLVLCDVPAFGYRAYALTEKEITDYPTHLLHSEREELPKGDIILENEYIRARFDPGSGQMQSLWNKEENKEMLSAPAGLHLVRTANDGMSAWRIGRYLQILPVNDTTKVWIKEGKLRKQAIFEQRVMHSTVRMTVSLDQGAKALAYDLEVDWHETCKAQPEIPVLSYRLPLKDAGDTIICDVPAGSAARKEKQMDVPALTGAFAAGSAAALITDCKYGYRLADGVLSVTLINTAGDPDPYPERGIHAIRLYVALTDGHAASFKALSRQLNRGMIAVPTARHEGALAPQASLMQVWAAHCVVTGVEVNAEDALVLRLYEAEGKKAMVTLQAPFTPKKALLTRLDGTPVAEAALSGDAVSFEMAPYTIAQLQLEK